MTSPSDVRKDKVLRALSVPMSIAEIAELLGANYYTVRKDIQDYVKGGVVAPTGGSRDGKALYTVGSVRPMPELRASASSAVRLDQLAIAYLKKPNSSAGTTAILNLSRVMAELLFLAISAKDTGAPVDAKTLNDLRSTARASFTRIDMLRNVAQSLMDQVAVWQTDKLAEIVDDPDFDAQDFLLAYESFLRSENDEAG